MWENKAVRLSSALAGVDWSHDWAERFLAPRTSRLLILMTLFVAALSPLTEYFYDWDQFLKTGHDFELSLLSLLIAVALTVLLARSLKHLSQRLSIRAFRLPPSEPETPTRADSLQEATCNLPTPIPLRI
jgi:hypothetical protein